MILAIEERLSSTDRNASEVMLMVTIERGAVTAVSPQAEVPAGGYTLEHYFRKPYREFIRIENGVILKSSAVPEIEKPEARLALDRGDHPTDRMAVRGEPRLRPSGVGSGTRDWCA